MTMTSLALSLPQATVALSVLACVFAALALWLLVWALRDVRGEEQASDPLRRDRQLSVLVVILGANALAQIPGIRPALEVLFLAALAAAIPLLYGAAIRHVRRALLSADEGEDTAEELDAAPDTRPE